MENYLTELTKRGGALKQERLPDWLADDPTDYGKNLWATFEVGLEALQADEELVSDGSLYIDVNYAHDWVNANTDPYATVVITLTDAGLH